MRSGGSEKYTASDAQDLEGETLYLAARHHAKSRGAEYVLRHWHLRRERSERSEYRGATAALRFPRYKAKGVLT